MAKNSITLGQSTFPSLEAAKAYVREILNRYDLRTRITGDDAEFLVSLFLRHPRRFEKLGGHSISSFEVRPHKHRTRAFHLVRTDGMVVDFSYLKCIY